MDTYKLFNNLIAKCYDSELFVRYKYIDLYSESFLLKDNPNYMYIIALGHSGPNYNILKIKTIWRKRNSYNLSLEPITFEYVLENSNTELQDKLLFNLDLFRYCELN